MSFKEFLKEDRGMSIKDIGGGRLKITKGKTLVYAYKQLDGSYMLYDKDEKEIKHPRLANKDKVKDYIADM